MSTLFLNKANSLLILLIMLLISISLNAQWTSIGPNGGSITHMAISHSDPNIIYAYEGGGEIFKSVDEGNTWNQSGYGGSNFLTVSPDNPEVIYTSYSGSSTPGLFKSSDSGENWENIGLETQKVFGITIDKTNPNKIYQYGADAEYPYKNRAHKSTNGGNTWNEIWQKDYQIKSMVIDVQNSNIIYLGRLSQNTAQAGFFVSSNGGNTWTEKRLTSSWDNIHKIISTEAALFVLHNNITDYNIYKSVNRGNTWTKLNSPDNRVKTLLVDHSNPDIIYYGPYKTTNGGSSWEETCGGVPHHKIYSYEISPSNPDVLFQSRWRTGIYKTNDGAGAWTKSSTGINRIKIIALTYNPQSDGTILMGSTYNPLFTTTDGGSTWNYLLDSPTYVGAIAVDPNNSSNFWAGMGYYSGNFHYIYNSNDAGTTWTEYHYLTCSPGTCSKAFEDIIINKDNPDHLLAAISRSGMVAKTTDGGSNWDRSFSKSTNGLAADPNNPSLVYLIEAKNVWNTNNFGGSWNEISIPGQVNEMMHIVVDNNSKVYAASTTAVWTWDGSAWTKFDNNPPVEITTLALHEKVNSVTVYIGTIEGLYATVDEGQSVENLNEGLDSMSVTSLMLTETDLYMGTESRGVWKADLPVNITEFINNHPVQFMLYQNYPNPFNPTTTIKYSIPVGSRQYAVGSLSAGQAGKQYQESSIQHPRKVSLKVYDVLGRQVAILVNEQQRPGNYSINFNASGLSSGVYYYRLNAANYTETRKMILIR